MSLCSKQTKTMSTAVAAAPRKKLTLKQIKDLPELTSKQKMWIKLKPHQAMIEIVKDRGLPEDWSTVFFRIRTGYEISKISFNKDVVEFYSKASSILEDMYNRHVACPDGKWRFRNGEEQHHVSVALENVDFMEEGETRETLIYTFRKARTQAEAFARKYPR